MIAVAKMSTKIKLQKCGDNLTVSLPLDLVTQLDWKPGDVCECHAEGESIRIVRVETAHERAMKIAEQVMDDYHDVFVALAKS
jgi:antitoxin component of MazEF toxin-antitoxin module